jgi:RHS repeat-associated protein
VPGATITYDGMGNMTADNLSNTYSYDAEGRPSKVNNPTQTLTYFDALGRAVDQTRAGVYTQIVYSPSGAKFAFMHSTTLIKYIDSMVAGMAAVHNGDGTGYFQHSDWLGSSRLAVRGDGTVPYDRAYAPFGEPYAETATTNRDFTGPTEDTAAGVYDFLFRQQSQSQGRWLVPDPAGLAAVDLTNPQTWNRYAYVANNPLSRIDPKGLYLCDSSEEDCNGPDLGGVGYFYGGAFSGTWSQNDWNNWESRQFWQSQQDAFNPSASLWAALPQNQNPKAQAVASEGQYNLYVQAASLRLKPSSDCSHPGEREIVYDVTGSGGSNMYVSEHQNPASWAGWNQNGTTTSAYQGQFDDLISGTGIGNSIQTFTVSATKGGPSVPINVQLQVEPNQSQDYGALGIWHGGSSGYIYVQGNSNADNQSGWAPCNIEPPGY